MWTLDEVKGITLYSPNVTLNEMSPEEREKHVAQLQGGRPRRAVPSRRPPRPDASPSRPARMPRGPNRSPGGARRPRGGATRGDTIHG